MKAIVFRCEDCGTLITARPDDPGRLQCPNCGGGVRRHEEDAPDATLVGVAVPGVADEANGDVVRVCSRDEVRENPREVFHRLVPWLGSSCLHATGMLMLMIAVAGAVSPPATESPTVPPMIGTARETGVDMRRPERELKNPDGTLFDQPRPKDNTQPTNRQARAQTKWGDFKGTGGAGGGRDAVLVRTRKDWNLTAVFGSGKNLAAPGEKDFNPIGTGEFGIFAGTGRDPGGTKVVIGPIGLGPDTPGPGPGGRFDNVVFVIDQSGSVLPAFERICGELIDFISYLEDTQSFHVVFFAKDTCQENPAGRLLPATEENKKEAARFLAKVNASGYGSCPIPALEAAFRALAGAKADQSKVLFLLTDGDFETTGREYQSGGRVLRGNDAVVAWLRDHNANRAVQINVIIVGDKPSSETEACMRGIAKDNRGIYRYVEPK